MSDELLNYYPVRITEFSVENGRVTVIYKETRKSFLFDLLLKRFARKTHHIDLDEIGSYVWQLCDGNKSINEIINLSKDHFGEKIEPAEDRVQKFIRSLTAAKFIQLYSKK